MKRKSLLMMLLVALFVPLAMNGQTRTDLTVADQTGTSSYVPFYGLYVDDYQHNQTIYPSTMLTQMQGGQITKLTYYLNSSVTKEYDATIEIRLGTTTSTAFSTGTVNYISISGNPVYTNTNLSVSGTTVEFDFSNNPYTYTSGNLVVDVRITSPGGWTSTTWLGESASTVYSAYGYGSSMPTQGNGLTFMPKTTFTYTVSSTPQIVLNPSSATVLTGSTQTLTASTLNVTGTPSISYTSSNTNVATVSGSGTTATVTAVSAGTATITATMTYNGNTYTAQCTITVEDPSYCTPAPTSVDGSGMHPVKFGSGDYVVNNTSYPTSSPYYGDYSSQVGAYEAGETASVEMSFYTYGYSSGYNYGAVIWVDWNKDYEFSDSEIVNKGTSTTPSSSSSPGTLTLTFNIPASTAAGDYRMRIGAADSYFDSFIGGTASAAHDPCYTGSYTCFHDYTLRVVATGAYTITCATTTGGTITADKNNADENDVVTITATPETDYMLTALTYTPEGGSAQNIDITNMPYTFTMPAANVTVNATFSLPSCPKPTNVTVSNLAASHATVSWTSDASEFTVKYSTATVTGSTLDPIFEDGFENGLDSWTTYANGFSGDGTTNWQTFDASQFEDQTNHGGSYSAMSRSWTSSTGDVSVDNWLVSPQMTLGNTLKFWVTTNSGYPDSYAVYVSTGSGVVPSSGTGDFVVVANLTPATGSWVEQTYDLSAYAGQQGYVAIRHKDSSKDHLLVDDFGVYNTINTYSYGGWTTVSPNPTTNSCQLTGLSAETLYEVQVQANCGGSDGSSAWSSAMFTTPDNCGAPQELASSDITATTATLSWADDKDSYNLQYRKVYFHESFESETMPTGWTTVDNNNDGLCWQIGSATAHSGVNGVCNSSFVYDADFSLSTTPDDYLISPQLDLQGTLRVWLSGFPRSSSNYSEHFEILLSTTGTSVSDFTTTLVTESTTANSYVEYTADLSSYEGQQGYIAIHHFNCTNQNYLYVDDFGLYGTENWVTLNPNPTTETADLTGLTPNTGYEWQVQGVNCDGNGGTTDWSAVATFSTLEIPAVPVTSIEASDINVIVGETATITPTVLPADATNPAVTYTSNDETIATVDDNGVVTGVAAGSTIITIAATDGSGVTATINVTVNGIDVTEITADNVTVATSETATISYTVAPTNATDQSVTFTSANTNIATVDANGVVTGVSAGETTITIASVSNPEVQTEITVTVTSNPNAVQFTVNAPAYARPGQTITVEAVLTAPTSGTYGGFNGLILDLVYDNTAFAFVENSTAYGTVAQAAQQMNGFILPGTLDNAVQLAISVYNEGSFVTTEGVVFSAQFTVLESAEGSFAFTAEPHGAGNFDHEGTSILYEATPSTVTIAALEQYTKTITGYGTGTGNWYLIASPIGDVAPTEVTNMLSNNYDLFYFDDAKENEWVNYKPNTSGQGNASTNPGFGLEKGKGYLYANSQTVDLIFTGYALTTTVETVELDYTAGDGVDLPGWNLVGNPFAEIAYLAGNCAFYTMDSDGNFTPTTNASIEAMEGIFVEVSATGQTLTFTTEQQAKSPVLNLNLSNGRKVIDRAIVRFDGGKQLSKLQFRQGSTKVYIPVEGHDYAVVNSEEMGEMPVSFKAEENGTYTFSFNAEEVSFAYLHLIDNLTGADVDLLETPSYSFEAKTTDYESRFKLVFATGNASDDNFAFFSNGSFVINNEGNAELQVIDIMGRIVKSESINGCANVSVNGAAGVYMLRLVNGDNVKVQKVVVK